jgi:DNA-binding NarL/FixJ family response regulator
MSRMTDTILVVDDHAGFRRSIRALLRAEGFDVVGEAPDGRTAITETERLRPALVLLDIQLPDIDGFAVASALAGFAEPPEVILISSRDRDAYAPQLDVAPVAGFITKNQLNGAAIRSLTR